MQEHALGKTKSTAPRRPFIVMMCEYFISKTDALRRETYFKTTKGRRALRIMLHRALCEQRKPQIIDLENEILQT
jgi:putative endonuclease